MSRATMFVGNVLIALGLVGGDCSDEGPEYVGPCPATVVRDATIVSGSVRWTLGDQHDDESFPGAADCTAELYASDLYDPGGRSGQVVPELRPAVRFLCTGYELELRIHVLLPELRDLAPSATGSTDRVFFEVHTACPDGDGCFYAGLAEPAQLTVVEAHGGRSSAAPWVTPDFVREVRVAIGPFTGVRVEKAGVALPETLDVAAELTARWESADFTYEPGRFCGDAGPASD